MGSGTRLGSIGSVGVGEGCEGRGVWSKAVGAVAEVWGGREGSGEVEKGAKGGLEAKTGGSGGREGGSVG